MTAVPPGEATTGSRTQPFSPITPTGARPGGDGSRARRSGDGNGPGAGARSRLTLRIFSATALVVAVVLTGTLAVTFFSARRALGVTAGTALDATSKHLAGASERLAQELETGARIFVANRAFSAPFEFSGDPGDYLDLAITASEEIGASWVQVTDRNGVLLARSDQPAAENVNVSGFPLIAQPLQGTSARGFGVTSDTILFAAAAVPIRGVGGGVVGTLMAATNLADSFADLIREETGSEIVFARFGDGWPVTIVAASSGVRDRRAAGEALERLLGPVAGDAGGAGGASSVRDTSMREGSIGGEDFVWTMVPIRTASGTELGGAIALRDRNAAIAPFRQMQLWALSAGALGLLVAFPLSLLVARQISRPVRALASAAQQASEGDYSAEIPVAGRDEIGTLASAFTRLLADLREKQALVEFLQSAQEGSTVPLRAATGPSGTGKLGGQIEPGTLIAGRYEVRDVLGAGGMGMVYRAFDRELGENIALKTLRPEMAEQDPEALNRFRSEIRLARRISHRNVVRTHDIGESGGLYFITMEYVDGESLKHLIKSRGRLPVNVALPVARQLCRALEVAHEAGVIHRDIKPQNMILERDGVLKVMDFGIARLTERTQGHTQAGMVVGTPEYMAPEQLLGDDVDARADIYAAGVVVYECLTGAPPHTADTPISLIARVLEDDPPAPRTVDPSIPASVSAAVMMAMSKRREDRPASAVVFATLLGNA